MWTVISQWLACYDPWLVWLILFVVAASVCMLVIAWRLEGGLDTTVGHTSWVSAFMDCERLLAEKRARVAAEEAREGAGGAPPGLPQQENPSVVTPPEGRVTGWPRVR